MGTRNRAAVCMITGTFLLGSLLDDRPHTHEEPGSPFPASGSRAFAGPVGTAVHRVVYTAPYRGGSIS